MSTSTMSPGAVTVSITRHVDPAHTAEMVAWMSAGSALAERFPGFLGTGWMRSATDRGEWHMLYRFADHEALAHWEASSQRVWWLGAAQGLVGESRVERRTGIEGWFDAPQEHDVEDLRAPVAAPPRWKQATVIWLTFFPLSLLVSWLLGQVAPGLPLLPRVLVSTLSMTPVMTYVALPRMTRALEWWLHGRPAPWRRAGRTRA